MQSKGPLQQILSKFHQVFQEGLGTYIGSHVRLEIDASATLKFCKAHTLPYSKCKAVEDEVNRLVKEGMLEPVEYSDWAAPIVAVLERLSNSDLWGFSNDCENLFATLQGEHFFYEIEFESSLSAAHIIRREIKTVCGINTHKGLLRYTHLLYMEFHQPLEYSSE